MMTTDRKNELILKLLDEKISGEEFQVLQQLLLEDSETLALYREHIVLDSALNKHFQFSLHSLRDLESKPTRYKKPLRVSLLAAAACVMISLVVAWFIQAPPAPLGAGIKFTGNSSYTISGGQGKDNGGRLEAGSVLQITHGAVELDLPKNVSAIVIAPATLRVKDDSTLVLDQGKASFIVPKEGQGFTVVTPRLKVTDLGTEFVVISGWGDKDEVHVTKGVVSVSTSMGSERLLNKGDATAVGDDGIVLDAEFTESHAHDALPERVVPVFEDDFEEPSCLDRVILDETKPGWGRGIPGWKSTAPMISGIYNPSGDGNWYDNKPELYDGSPSKGIAKGMKGPCLGFFLCDQPGGVEKEVCRIKGRNVYTMSVTLGTRKEVLLYPHGGYNIALVSGNTVLQSVKSISPPCDLSNFTTITMTWDSSKLPSGIREGDRLSIRISNNNTARKREAYVDFDNVRVTRMQYSKKNVK